MGRGEGQLTDKMGFFVVRFVGIEIGKKLKACCQGN